MAEPQTPRRPHGSVDGIVSELNSRYGLCLPIRGEAWSPSTSRGLHSEEDKIVNSIRILYFQDNELLQKILNDFDIKSNEIHSEWRFKPRAEADVIPHERRRKNAPQPFWMNTTSLPDPDVVEALIPVLATFLAKPRQEIKSRLSSKRLNHGIMVFYLRHVSTDNVLQARQAPMYHSPYATQWMILQIKL